MKVTCTVGRTISLGNYEFVRIDFGAEVTVKEGETSKQAWDRAQKMCEERLNVEAKKITDRLKG